MSVLTNHIKAQAHSLGFDVVGVAPVSSSAYDSDRSESERENSFSRSLWEALSKWLAAGFHGSMAWLARDPYRRSHPQSVLPGCRSVIMVGMNYWSKDELVDKSEFGRVARYAWGKDYHKILSSRLKKLEQIIQKLCPGEHTRSYVDTGAIMEKPWAQKAGIGWIGKHTNLVSTEFGSWLVLGEILTTMPLETDDPGTDLCGTCSLCIQACPTGAILAPYLLDAERCISYLTIEHRGTMEEIPEELRKKMGNKIFGCDDCLEICPFNVHAHPTKEEAFQPLPWVQHLALGSLLNMSKEDFQKAAQGSPLRRPKYEGFMRNVTIASTNQRNSASSSSAQ
ncbi:MAG: tRNA epoxyqueuosine(34) reductase QueG [Nitrospirales bacterium]